VIECGRFATTLRLVPPSGSLYFARECVNQGWRIVVDVFVGPMPAIGSSSEQHHFSRDRAAKRGCRFRARAWPPRKAISNRRRSRKTRLKPTSSSNSRAAGAVGSGSKHRIWRPPEFEGVALACRLPAQPGHFSSAWSDAGIRPEIERAPRPRRATVGRRHRGEKYPGSLLQDLAGPRAFQELGQKVKTWFAGPRSEPSTRECCPRRDPEDHIGEQRKKAREFLVLIRGSREWNSIRPNQIPLSAPRRPSFSRVLSFLLLRPGSGTSLEIPRPGTGPLRARKYAVQRPVYAGAKLGHFGEPQAPRIPLKFKMVSAHA